MRIPSRASRRRMSGVSLIELMISILLGLMVLAALISVFASTSAARTEMERTSRQIENGRFAMDVLSDEIRQAGFYGELDVKTIVVPGAIPDACSILPADWASAMPFHVQGFDNGVGVPACVPAGRKAGTDVLVIRRVATCEADIGGCPAAVNGQGYLQVSKCGVQPPEPNFLLDRAGAGPFNLRLKSCDATPAGKAPLRRYMVNIFYIGTDNGQGQPIPTLKELQYDGNALTELPLVEGIEELNFEYGVDNNKDGAPDTYTADPTNYTYPGCLDCTPPLNWNKVVTVRIYLLARNIEASPNYVDPKTYSLGRDTLGAEITVTPNDAYKRHAYTGVVRVVNASERRDAP